MKSKIEFIVLLDKYSYTNSISIIKSSFITQLIRKKLNIKRHISITN